MYFSFYGALIALSLSSVVYCQDEPEITQIILPEIRRAGETGRLNCTITRQGTNVVHWIHADDQMVISSDDTIEIDASLNPIIDGYLKYDVVKTVNNMNQLTTYTLVIQRLQPTDAGTYTCQVHIEGTSRNIQKDGEMVVMVPPTIINSLTTQTVTKMEGTDILLQCAANSYPDPVIKWVRPNGKALPLPGDPFSIASPTLQLTNIRKEDRGVYRCIADNNVPPAGVYDATLYIQFKPSARAVQTSYGQAQNRQFDITLECRIEGFPEPDLQWFQIRNGGREPISNDDRHIVHVLYSHGQELSISEFWFQLTIINVLGNDFGEFECEGRNDLGTHSATVTLYETSECQGPNCPAETFPSSSQALSYWLLSSLLAFIPIFLL